MSNHPAAAATRRTLLRRATALALADGATDAPDPANVSTRAATPGESAPAALAQPADAALLAAYKRFCALERRMLHVIEGPGRIDDDDARDPVLEVFRDAQRPHLDLLCRLRATSLAGHRARAIAFALWDGGETAHRAALHGLLEDRLLAALVRDLAGLDP